MLYTLFGTVSLFDFAKVILEGLKKSIGDYQKGGKNKYDDNLVGNIGFEWSKPVFIPFVRQVRFTREQFDKSWEFTINIP